MSSPLRKVQRALIWALGVDLIDRDQPEIDRLLPGSLPCAVPRTSNRPRQYYHLYRRITVIGAIAPHQVDFWSRCTTNTGRDVRTDSWTSA